MSPGIESNQEGHSKAVKRGDGRLSVTLLGLAMAAAAAVIFQLSFTYIDPHDTLAPSVPADAVFYLHINADRIGNAAGMLLPENIRADEIAKFAVVNNDKGISWGALFAWRRGHQPTDDERRLLDEDRALKLDDGTYLVADESVKQSYAAGRTWSSLADDDGAARSLAAVRGLAPVQGYLNPVIAPPRAMAGAASFLKELDPLVFGADPQEDGYFAIAMPVRAAAALPAFIGFGAGRRGPDDAGLTDALASTVRLTADQPVFDAMTVFFGRVEKGLAAPELTYGERADVAASGLRKLLADSAVNLSTFTEEGTNKTYVSAEFPDIAPHELISAVAAYLGDALPERSSLALPDGDAITEIRTDPERYVAAKSADESGYRTLDVPSIDLKLIFTDNGRGGVIMANHELMVERYRVDTMQETRFKGKCATLGGRKIGIRGSLLKNMASLFGLSKIPSVSGVNDIKFGLIIENPEGVLFTCGYR